MDGVRRFICQRSKFSLHVCEIQTCCVADAEVMLEASPDKLEPVDLVFSLLLLVSSDGEEVEPDLRGLVALDAGLDLFASEILPVFFCAGSIANGTFLEAIQLVQLPIDWNIGDEVEGVLFLAPVLGVLDLEGVLPSEAVVRSADHLRVADGPAAIARSQGHAELLQIPQLISDVYIVLSVQQNAQQGISGTGVVDHLIGKEELRVIVGERLFGGTCRLLLPLEEEDETVDWLDLG